MRLFYFSAGNDVGNLSSFWHNSLHKNVKGKVQITAVVVERPAIDTEIETETHNRLHYDHLSQTVIVRGPKFWS